MRGFPCPGSGCRRGVRGARSTKRTDHQRRRSAGDRRPACRSRRARLPIRPAAEPEPRSRRRSADDGQRVRVSSGRPRPRRRQVSCGAAAARRDGRGPRRCAPNWRHRAARLVRRLRHRPDRRHRRSRDGRRVVESRARRCRGERTGRVSLADDADAERPALCDAAVELSDAEPRAGMGHSAGRRLGDHRRGHRHRHGLPQRHHHREPASVRYRICNPIRRSAR